MSDHDQDTEREEPVPETAGAATSAGEGSVEGRSTAPDDDAKGDDPADATDDFPVADPQRL